MAVGVGAMAPFDQASHGPRFWETAKGQRSFANELPPRQGVQHAMAGLATAMRPTTPSTTLKGADGEGKCQRNVIPWFLVKQWRILSGEDEEGKEWAKVSVETGENDEGQHPGKVRYKDENQDERGPEDPPHLLQGV